MSWRWWASKQIGPRKISFLPFKVRLLLWQSHLLYRSTRPPIRCFRITKLTKATSLLRSATWRAIWVRAAVATWLTFKASRWTIIPSNYAWILADLRLKVTNQRSNNLQEDKEMDSKLDSCWLSELRHLKKAAVNSSMMSTKKWRNPSQNSQITKKVLEGPLLLKVKVWTQRIAALSSLKVTLVTHQLDKRSQKVLRIWTPITHHHWAEWITHRCKIFLQQLGRYSWKRKAPRFLYRA